MTSHKPEDDASATFGGELTDALARKGDLIPETPSEVRAAEDAIDEDAVELPVGLRSYRSRDERRGKAAQGSAADGGRDAAVGSRPVLRTGRAAKSATAGVVIPFFAAGAGFAVAAAILLVLLWPERPDTVPPIAGIPDEFQPDKPAGEKVKVAVEAACKDCCAGQSCPSAPTELRECASGRGCVSCRVEDGQNAYKIRISALHVRPEEERWFADNQLKLADLELCALAKEKPLGCRPAGESPDDLLQWSSLPTASTRDQLVGGIELRLVSRQRGTLATWKNSVRVTTETLCRGVAATLQAEDGKGPPVGKVSAFFDDAYFVEIARGATVASLKVRMTDFEGAAKDLVIYKTTKAGGDAFALVVGPLAREPAEKVRWQLLDQEVAAKITFGEDHEGRARPADASTSPE